MKALIKFSPILLLFFFNSCSKAQDMSSLRAKAKEAFTFCKEKGMDTTRCHLIDMSIHSGKFRYFVWNFQKDTIIDKGLVSHGCGKSPWMEGDSKTNPKFSNVPESHLSSLGKYAIRKRGYSTFGIHINYKLHGLESTNSNAYKRLIVLHSWSGTTNEEIYPRGTAESWGCPAVSNDFMRRLDAGLKGKKKDVLLWIFK